MVGVVGVEVMVGEVLLLLRRYGRETRVGLVEKNVVDEKGS